MKKSLVLTVALALGITGAAFAAAANPFADVPQKHWAYDAVSKLAKAGIVDGYDSKTFGGEKAMTRYEMAQVVGKAMNKSEKADADNKKLIDKLSVEFAAELNNLGVRVSKLEANQPNVKISGDARVRWNNTANKADGQQFKDRFRVNLTSQINDTTSMFARLVITDDNFNQDSKQRLSDMALTTKFDKNNSVTLGRYSLNMGASTYLAGTTGDLDGIMTNSKIGNFGLMLGYAQIRQNINSMVTNNLYIKNVAFAEGTYTTGKAKIYADYFKNLNDGASDGNAHVVLDAYKVAGISASYKFDNNFKMNADYYKNSAKAVKMSDGSEPTATAIRVDYKGVSAAKPGSWGAYVEYNKFVGNALPYAFAGPTTKSNPADLGITNLTQNGLKSFVIGADYGLAKNVTFNAYYQFNAKNTETGADAPNKTFTRAQINYAF